MAGTTTISPLLLLLILFFIIFSISFAESSMNQHQFLRDGDSLVSSDKSFVLGFFSPGSSKSRYLGIWYSFSNQTVVWVANRQNPIPDSTGVLKFGADGNLILVCQDRVAWSTGMASNASNPEAHLLESGNLILKSASTNGSTAQLWQSFDHPSDTLLPTMKFGLELITGLNRFLVSWKNPNDPSPGEQIYMMNPQGTHEIYVRGKKTKYRLGPWNGLRFSGIPKMVAYSMFKFTYVSNQHEVYYSFEATTPGIISRLVIAPAGVVQRLAWSKETQTWNPFWEAPTDECDAYAKCGANGVCDNEAPEICRCYRGYQPISWSAWQLRDYRLGCTRKDNLNCDANEGFRMVKGVKLPDTTNSTVDISMALTECKFRCLKNCSCTAYAAADISSSETGIGCIMWFGDLVDTRVFTVDGQDLYLRVPASELADQTEISDAHKKTAVTIAVVVIFIGLILVGACGALIWNRRRRKKKRERSGTGMNNIDDSTHWEDELPLFDFTTIASTTGNFANEKKIGEGGFGSVYQGRMGDGQEIAVKRLSSASASGLSDFMNEVMLIAKLQHRNIVRLLGCCIKGEERLLVYEYMQNKSLDAFIFDMGAENRILMEYPNESKRTLLDWRKRVDIIVGISRGLLYLHEDSRLKIIHRDLKGGNVLLDEKMTPKISDFGTARIFGTDQMEENTRRVIGTYGYMSPEYAMDGIFSVKSDVFSFGVLILEIISGKKNRVFYQEEMNLNLLALAWRLWKDGHGLELLDETLTCSCPTAEILRCIQIGLLCVQECAADRPTMSTVVFMLSNEISPLPEPKRPGFCIGRSIILKDTEFSTGQSSTTVNEVTCTQFKGR